MYFQNVEETDYKVDSPQLTKTHKTSTACHEINELDKPMEVTEHDDTLGQLVVPTCPEFSFIATTSTPIKTPPKDDVHETNPSTEPVGTVKRKRGRPRKVLTEVDVSVAKKDKNDVSNEVTFSTETPTRCLRNSRRVPTRNVVREEDLSVGKRTGLRSHMSI